MASRMWVRKTSLLISVRETPITAKGSGSTRLWNKRPQGGYELALGEIARSAEDHHHAGFVGHVIPPGHRAHRLDELVECGRLRALEVNSRHAAAGLGQGLEIAQGLGRLQRPETVAGARDDELLRVVAGELQKEPVRLPALVELAGGVQIARAVRHRGGDLEAIAQEGADLLQALPRVAGSA